MSDDLEGRFRRLSAIANLCAPCDTAADIGCDHGYLSILLVRQKKARRVIACDLRPGPLAAAEKNVTEAGLSAQISLRLADGFTGLVPGEADTVIIAGMGGPLMQRILTDGSSAAKACRQLVLAPQSDVGAFRRFLWKEGYVFLAEDMACEDGKYYPLMRVCPVSESETAPDYDEADFAFGPLLRKQGNPVFSAWLKKQEYEQWKIRDRLSAQKTNERIARRLRETEAQLALIAQAAEQMETK